MTLIDAFKSTENMLMDAGIDDYRFDSECHSLKDAGKTRRDVLCHGDDVLSEQDEKLLLKLAKRRALGEPYNIYSVNGIFANLRLMSARVF